MGTHASAEVFYGVAWPAEELPEKWAREQQARYDAGDYDTEDDDSGERLRSLLKELGLDSLLEVGSHGNMAYDYSGDAVRVIGTRTRIGCGDVVKFAGKVTDAAQGARALDVLLDHLGRDKAEVGWLVTVTYG